MLPSRKRKLEERGRGRRKEIMKNLNRNDVFYSRPQALPTASLAFIFRLPLPSVLRFYFLLPFRLHLPERYGGSPEFLPGVVTCTEDGVSINFDAGWHGASIPLKDVRRANTNAGSSAMPAASGGGQRKDKPASLTAGAQLRSMGNILDLDVGSLGGDSFSVGDQVHALLAVL